MSLGGGKCRNCGKTSYSQESISYDNQIYHKRCFRCTKCESVVSLGKVAMIQGDLYCKPCFLKMFAEKGTYHVFGQKTLPRHMLNASGGGSSDSPRGSVDQSSQAARLSTDQPKPSESPAPAAATPAAAAATPAAAAAEPATAAAEPAAVAPPVTKVASPTATTPTLSLFAKSAPASAGPKICVIDDCQNPRVAGKNLCEKHLGEKTAESERKLAPGVEAISAAVHSKSVQDVRDLLHQYGPGICLATPASGKSALEIAFTNGGVECGQAMVETLADYLKDLEADVAMLKDQMAPEKE